MRRNLAAALVSVAVTLPVAATADALDLENMSEEDRAAFRQEVRDYLLDDPGVIVEAIRILEEREAVAARQSERQIIEAHREALLDDGFSYVGGNPEGDVTVVEFLDYRCGYCKRAHPEVAELLERDPGVRLVVKEFPILGPDSVKAGKMALAALEIDPSKYAALNDSMMTFPGNLTEDAAYRIAEDLGYDTEKLREMAESAEIDDRLSRNYQLAQALGLQGTPAFVIGDEVIRGYVPAERMEAVVQEARAASD